MLQKILTEYGFAIDLGIIILIIILVEQFKPLVIKKWGEGKVMYLNPILAFIAVIFLSDEIHFGEQHTGWLHIIREVGAQWLWYVAGSYLVYKLGWVKLKPLFESKKVK